MSNPSLSLPKPPDDLLALSEQLCTRIVNAFDDSGVMGFDRFMAMALYEPGLGYYVNGLHKFGAAGDFVTAPGQGRIFATVLATQLDAVGADLGPDWTLLELGAGAGELARDLLAGLNNPPGRYLILEPSATLREVQTETLATLPSTLQARIEWISAPPEEAFDGAIVANEVIDALPVARFEWTDEGPVELGVTFEQGRFQWRRTQPSRRLDQALKALQGSLATPLPAGYQSEICVDLVAWIATVTKPLNRGLALLIDYGYPRHEYYHPDRSSGTLVCHYRHRAHFDPFVWPGLTDLSAFVDFTAVAEAATDCGLEVAGFTSQAGFLLSLGAHELVDQATNEREHMRLAGELKRLILPGEMGEKFKVIGLTRGFDQPLAGFEMMSQLERL